MSFDFSKFHPLDHWAFSIKCFGWYGGPFRHLKLWVLIQSPDPLGILLCKLNKHGFVPYWDHLPDENEEPTGYECDRCGIYRDD